MVGFLILPQVKPEQATEDLDASERGERDETLESEDEKVVACCVN